MQIRPHEIKLTTAAAPVAQSRRENVNRNARNVFSGPIKRRNDELRDRGSVASLPAMYVYAHERAYRLSCYLLSCRQ